MSEATTAAGASRAAAIRLFWPAIRAVALLIALLTTYSGPGETTEVLVGTGIAYVP